MAFAATVAQRIPVNGAKVFLLRVMLISVIITLTVDVVRVHGVGVFDSMMLKTVSNRECFFVHRQKKLLLSVYVDDIKLAGKKQKNIDLMWKVLNKEVDLGEPSSFVDYVYLGCTQRQCEYKQRYCGQLQSQV